MQKIQHTTLMFVAKNLNYYGTYVHILSVVFFFRKILTVVKKNPGFFRLKGNPLIPNSNCWSPTVQCFIVTNIYQLVRDFVHPQYHQTAHRFQSSFTKQLIGDGPRTCTHDQGDPQKPWVSILKWFDFRWFGVPPPF